MSGSGAGDAVYRAVVEADPNLVFIADAQGRIVRVNSRWIEYTGITVEQIGAERTAPLHVVHPDDLERTWTAWTRALETGVTYELSYRLRSVKDGRYRWFLARAVPQRGNGGEIVGWYGVATEIDAQVRAAERSQFLTEASVALNSSLDREHIVSAFLKAVVARFSEGCVLVAREPDGTLRREAIAHRDPETEARARERSAHLPIVSTSHSVRVIETKRSLLIPEVDDDTHTGWINADGISLTRIFGPVRSILTVPMLLAGKVAGAFTFVASDERPPFDEYDLQSAETVARQAATAMEHASIFARERDAAERFRYLTNATDQLFATRDLSQDIETFLQSLVGYWADRAILYVLGQESSVRAHAVAYSGSDSAAIEEFRGERIFVRESEKRFVREIVEKRRSWLRTDVTVESLYTVIQPFLHPVVDKLRPRSLLIVPLYTPDYDFGALGVYLKNRNYAEEDREMFEELGRRLSIAIEHSQSIGRERRLAQTLQEVTLPAVLASIPGGVLSTAYATATTSEAPVGGDWYDAFRLRDGRTVLSIGDVTGSGLRASAIMGKLRNAINAISLYESDPARILDGLEYILLQRYPEVIATAFIAILDLAENRLTYANAGHPHPLIRRWDGTIEWLATDGLPVGSRGLLAPAQSRTRPLDDVAMIAFYTDGVTESMRDLADGEKRLCEALASEGILYVRAPATMLSDACIPEGPHDDDAAVMVISFPRSAGWSFEAENARAAQAARGSFVERLRSDATLESDLVAAEIVFGELVGNVVRHAPGSIDVALEWRGDRAVLHVVDRGPGFDYVPSQEIDLMREDGRGLWLAHQFGEHVTIERLPGFGAHVSVELPVWRADPAARVNVATPKTATAAATKRRSKATR